MDDFPYRSLLEAAACQAPVLGLTHNFYRYPARFSPQLARAIVEAFSEPGEMVLDPFMGGGTTLVEAAALGRRTFGADLSSLAVFVTRAKTTPMSAKSVHRIKLWAERIRPSLTLHRKTQLESNSATDKRLRNFNCRLTWRIRRTTQQALESLDELPRYDERRLVRCAILRTAQWAVDGRKKVPGVDLFREKFFENLAEMLKSILDFSEHTATWQRSAPMGQAHVPVCKTKKAACVDLTQDMCGVKPRLILTSPPYPGVHILYHRWQIGGGKETPAPFWIAGCVDGQGAAHYTFGDRQSHDRSRYYELLTRSFGALAKLCDRNTRIVQVVGFADPGRQLPRYLAAMMAAGFTEERSGYSGEDQRLWRSVPNRRWYADQKGPLSSSREVVLFHRLS